MSWNDLEKDIMKMAEDMTSDARNIYGEAVLDAMSERVPVLTGNLWANTIVSVNSPDYSENSKKDPARFSTYIEGVSKLKSAMPFDTVYIQNNTEYNYLIEFDGYSRKAPNGYFELSVFDGNRVIERL